MKLGIIGVGAVGSAIAMAAASRAQVREIVLVNRNRARAKAVATDMHYGAALSPIVMIRDGDYADLADAGLAIITAGVNEKAGGATDRNDPAGRLRLLDANVKVRIANAQRLARTDPEAAVGRDKRGGFRPLYNAQIAYDLDSELILATEVFAQQNDTGTLPVMLTVFSTW